MDKDKKVVPFRDEEVPDAEPGALDYFGNSPTENPEDSPPNGHDLIGGHDRDWREK